MKNIHSYIWRFACIFMATASIVLFWKNTVLISTILLVLAILINIKSNKKEIIYFISIAILATIVESIAISTEAWIYTNKHILNFPLWLPLYWGMGGVVLKDIYLILTNK
jgi:hypothetical protein